MILQTERTVAFIFRIMRDQRNELMIMAKNNNNIILSLIQINKSFINNEKIIKKIKGNYKN